MNLIQPTTLQTLYLENAPFSLLFLYMYQGLSSVVISNGIFLQIGFHGRKIISQNRTIIFNSSDSTYNRDFQSVMIFKYVVKNGVKNVEFWFQIDLDSNLGMQITSFVTWGNLFYLSHT